MDRTILPLNPKRPRAARSVVDIRDAEPHPLPVRPLPPEGAPNVLVVLVDDMGFGASSAYGGPCRMPAADRLAAEGLRYTRFHTTAICAPTRMSLLTGRNHHSTGMGIVPELGTSSPGLDGIRPDNMAMLPQILSENGYLTGAFGKMHQTPLWELGETGPFDRWPMNEGFDRFYGFIGAETNQFYPALIDGFTPIDAPRTPEKGYHLSEDLVDQAAGWIQSVSALEPDRPWFTYLSFGACHDPLQVPEEWRGRYRDEFSQGWSETRERIFARQKELGVIPADAELTEFDPHVPDWDSLSDTERLVSQRMMELYAEMAEHMDVQVDRLLNTIDELGQLDNTLVIYILGDNGAAAEGGRFGTHNNMATLNRVPMTLEQVADRLDEAGGPNTFSNYPIGWALAMCTPYQQSKKYASHYGGTRNGMIVRWPAGIGDAGGEVRHQWHHVIDIAPTILEAAGIPQPKVVNGVEQAPIEGTSLAYSFNDAEAPEQHITQYFEVMGSRGIYQDGWTCVTRHQDVHWSRQYRLPPPMSEDVWELYDTTSDWTQASNVADQHPERVAKMKEAFLIEATRYNALPLDDRLHERFSPETAPRPDLLGHRHHITLRPSMRGIREGAAPNVKNTSFTMTAHLEVPESGAEGVLIAQGGRFAGWSLYVHQGAVAYCYNHCGTRTYVRAPEPLTVGAHTATVRFRYDGGGLGKGGEVELLVDDAVVATGRVEATVGWMFSVDETLDVGCDRQSPVTDDYADHPRNNRFTGKLDRVELVIGDDAKSPDPADIAEILVSRT
ncbi:MAG: arylsulfatase [Propionibacteriaceae bacterium]|nr:arylsulfatase [Propionibacteriaceae bacterium]